MAERATTPIMVSAAFWAAESRFITKLAEFNAAPHEKAKRRLRPELDAADVERRQRFNDVIEFARASAIRDVAAGNVSI